MNSIIRPKLVLISPCFNEEQVISETINRLETIFDDLINKKEIHPESFICFVNDGSSDKTWSLIEERHQKSKIIKGIDLSRNFGHQNALLAGLIRVKNEADCIISMDADLQDDVNLIYSFVEKYKEGYEIIYGVRKNRDKDGILKKFSALLFYKFQSLMKINIIVNHADYRLMSNRAVSVLSTFGEKNLYLRGIIPLLGFKSTKIYYNRDKRYAGESKYPVRKMLSFAFDGITSFSTIPLRIIIYGGFAIFILTILTSLCLLFYNIIHKLSFSGWTLIALSIYLLCGVQLMSIGLLGEYIGRIYKEVKNRPNYIINKELF